ncbi:MAG: ribosome recycling factor [Deltaproteobacteria bacterium RBG_16_54_11]|nr:MAG: ribosome recycling factor [Deltaproteobacteria bacterium RBG_16_54_11]
MESQAIKECEMKMKRTILALEKELGKVRTGRASLALLDDIRVDYYGTPTPLNQAATLSVPESRLIVIQPWDNSLLGEIEKAILKSELGMTPTNDGKVIRITIPRLTEERRKELVKVVKKMGESSKVGVRNIRRDVIEELRTMEKGKDISEDELHQLQNQVQKTTDTFVEKIDEVIEAKEKEIMEI